LTRRHHPIGLKESVFSISTDMQCIKAARSSIWVIELGPISEIDVIRSAKTWKNVFSSELDHKTFN
jgi:hypothetical protein